MALALARIAQREDEARREALQVPLPRGGKCFVEVIDVEDKPPLRASEAAEIRRVAIAASLHANSCCGRVGKIESHQ